MIAVINRRCNDTVNAAPSIVLCLVKQVLEAKNRSIAKAQFMMNRERLGNPQATFCRKPGTGLELCTYPGRCTGHLGFGDRSHLPQFVHSSAISQAHHRQLSFASIIAVIIISPRTVRPCELAFQRELLATIHPVLLGCASAESVSAAPAGGVPQLVLARSAS